MKLPRNCLSLRIGALVFLEGAFFFLFKCQIMDNNKLFTKEQVSKLLQTQRGNCYVAILKATNNPDLAKIALQAPEPGQWEES